MIHEQGDMIGETKLFTEPPVFDKTERCPSKAFTTRSWKSLSLLLHKMSLLGSVCVEFKVSSSRLGVCWIFLRRTLLSTLHLTATKDKLNLGGPFSHHVQYQLAPRDLHLTWASQLNFVHCVFSACSRQHRGQRGECRVTCPERHAAAGTCSRLSGENLAKRNYGMVRKISIWEIACVFPDWF